MKTARLLTLLAVCLLPAISATAQFYYSDGRQIPLGEMLLDNTALIASL
jgi:hypothetical protein